MPKEDQNIIEYTSKGYEECAPFVIQNGFECFNIQHSTTTRNTTNSYTGFISTYEPNSYAVHISVTNQFENKSDDGDSESYYLFRGDNTIEHLTICFIDIQENIKLIRKYHDLGSNNKFLSFKIPIFSIT